MGKQNNNNTAMSMVQQIKENVISLRCMRLMLRLMSQKGIKNAFEPNSTRTYIMRVISVSFVFWTEILRFISQQHRLTR